MNSFLRLIKQKLFFTRILLTCLFLVFQNQAFADEEDKEQILAIANWASINFPDIFFDDYDGPFTGFGYRYVCFVPSNNCIGINQENANVDARINDEIITAGTVSSILAQMSASQSGILNLSGDSVNNNTIPAVFSPGLGEVTEAGGEIFSIDWKIISDEGTNQQEICDFSVLLNSANPGTLVNLTFTRQLFAGGGLNQWSVFAAEIPGVIVDFESRTLTITEDVIWPKISGGSDELGVAAGSKLLF